MQSATRQTRLLIMLCWLISACWSNASATQQEQRFHSSLQSAAPAKPFIVNVGAQVDQIVSIDQKSENFAVVGNLRLEWDDPALAFEAGEGESVIKHFTVETFTQYVDQNSIFAPGFLIQNQQGRRFSQGSVISIFPNGHAVYLERFTVTLQAPEFEFTKYPFDTQQFFLRIAAVMPTEYMRFQPLDGYSSLGEQLGEEEWLVDKSWAIVDEIDGITGKKTSHFTFGFEGSRHLNYYYLRIFLPLLIIIAVSWFTFFLNDYSKRVDMAVTNLLVFVAFNFTISNHLPRLGYLTFIDAVMFTTFVFAAIVVLVNVIFRRMEVHGREGLARHLDQYTIWVYPFSLGGLIFACWALFVRV